MKIVIFLLLLHFIAARKPQPKVFMKSFNKDYFRYFNISRVFLERYKFETIAAFHLLKTLRAADVWLEFGYYHFRNNQYHMIPIGRGIPAKTFLDNNSFGIGASFKEQIPEPITPGKYAFRVPSHPTGKKNSSQLEVPILGEYKIAVVIKIGDVEVATISWMGNISSKSEGQH